MKKILAILLCASVAYCATPASPMGIDVNAQQPNVNWTSVKSGGVEFAYIKASEGISYSSPTFNKQYTDAGRAGLIRGAYHTARPENSTGDDQARYFFTHGRGWIADGKTLPGALALGAPGCSGLNKTATVAWITAFSNTYRTEAGRLPVIYTTTSWWTKCTGNSTAFSNNPLWWVGSLDPLPAGWQSATFLQYATGRIQPNQDYFLGCDSAALLKFANNQ